MWFSSFNLHQEFAYFYANSKSSAPNAFYIKLFIILLFEFVVSELLQTKVR